MPGQPVAKLPLGDGFRGAGDPKYLPSSMMETVAYRDFLEEAVPYSEAIIEEIRQALWPDGPPPPEENLAGKV